MFKESLNVYKILFLINLFLVLTNEACPTDTTGFICSTCIDGCDSCSTIDSCDTCSKTFYLEVDSGTGLTICTSCPTKCLICSSPFICDKCTPGYDTAIDGNTGYEYCTFYWWKWFLIIFGSLLGIILIGKLLTIQEG